MAVSSVVAVAGIGLAVFFFLKTREAADRVARQFAGLHRLLENKYYVDEIYDAAIVQPIQHRLRGRTVEDVDVRLIDGAVNGVARGGAGRQRDPASSSDRLGARVRRVAVSRSRDGAGVLPVAIADPDCRLWALAWAMPGVRSPESGAWSRFTDDSSHPHVAHRPADRRRDPAAVREGRRAAREDAADRRAARVGARVRRDAAALEPVSTRRRPTSSSSSVTRGFPRSGSAISSAWTASACSCSS